MTPPAQAPAGFAPPFKVGVDIGGTFTDLVVVDRAGQTLLHKEPSTPRRPAEAIERGVAELARMTGREQDTFLADTELFVHGSTVALNTILERSGPRTALVCTQGFRDVLAFRDGHKPDRFDLHLQRPADYVDRHLRLGVEERIGPGGVVWKPLEDDSVRAAAATMREAGVEAVAVALLWSHANAAHEQRVRELLAEELPDAPVVLSSEVLPEIGEWMRTSATVLSAYIYDRSSTYLRGLAAWLEQQGSPRELFIMQGNGGSSTVERSLRVPVSLIGSGPAAAPVGGRQYGKQLARQDLLVIDVGGTSLDVCLVQDGEMPRTRHARVAEQPLGAQAVEIHSIGAGGGSIAWVDSGGMLRVGPASAGADPGPAAYDRGGTLPTVTDANVVLGYLGEQTAMGGRTFLRRDLAEQAIAQHVARRLSCSVEQAAQGIIKVADHLMVDALRVVSLRRGIDPRRFTMVVGGGAGALHAGRMAAVLGIRRVLVPREAGTLSAFGMTVADVQYDHSATYHAVADEVSATQLRELLDVLAERARQDLAGSGFSSAQMRFPRSVDARYVGQIHELAVELPDGDPDAALIDEVRTRFHALHRQRYGFALEETAVEFLHWRVSGVAVGGDPAVGDFEGLDAVAPAPEPASRRQAFFAEAGGYVETPVFESDSLRRGMGVQGPAVIEGTATTIVVLPGHVLTADGRGSFLLTVPDNEEP